MQSGWAQYVYSAIMDKVGDRSNSTINQWQVVRSRVVSKTGREDKLA